VTFEFKETSIDNNIVAQMFEFSQDGIDKLSIIDYGYSTVTGEHIFFLGKVITDDEGVQTFMNIFTLVFDNKD